MAALLKDAIMPNLVQTIEGNPAIIHGGPFANIAQGTNTVIATRMGMSLSEFVVTEAGFGCDLGAEKFFDIKCVSAGLAPKAVVLVATVRALRYHGGADLKMVGEPNPIAVEHGLDNLQKHIENIDQFGLRCIVAINKFTTDTDEEIELIKNCCEGLGHKAVVADVWADGGRGAEELAHAIVDVAENSPGNFQPLYDWNWPVKQKIETIASKIYGANGVDYLPAAKLALRRIKKLGLEHLPVCVAKTQKSLSDNPDLIGRPKDFEITVRKIEIAAGAGFLIPITGDIMRMPGLPVVPSAENIDIDDNGRISGLF